MNPLESLCNEIHFYYSRWLINKINLLAHLEDGLMASQISVRLCPVPELGGIECNMNGFSRRLGNYRVGHQRVLVSN